jgi:hypothetical protein
MFQPRSIDEFGAFGGMRIAMKRVAKLHDYQWQLKANNFSSELWHGPQSKVLAFVVFGAVFPLYINAASHLCLSLIMFLYPAL